MEPIKLESELRLETIFASVNKGNVNSLNILSSLKEIDIDEKTNINKFIYLLKNTDEDESYKLNIETLKREFPDLYFDNYEVIPEEALNDYINMYINNRKNLYNSKKLFNLANLVRTNGITEDILNQLNSVSKSDSVSIKYQDISKNIIEIYKNKVVDSGISSSVNEIDKDTGGLQPGTITTILGFTGAFKTTWAINIAYNSAKNNKNTLYLSLEVTKENIYYDLLSRHSADSKFNTHIEANSLKHKKLTDEQLSFLENKVYPDFNSLNGKIYIIDETELENYSFYSLENKFREIDEIAVEETGHGIDLLVIDHAQLLKFDSSMKGIGNETNIVNAYVSFLRQQSLNWIKTGRSVATLVLSQASRTGHTEAEKNNGVYKLTALAEANELERASSLVLSTYVDESLKNTKQARIQIIKNRDGLTWMDPIDIFIDPAYYIFGDKDKKLSVNPTSSFDFGNLSDMLNVNLDDSLSSIDLNDVEV